MRVRRHAVMVHDGTEYRFGRHDEVPEDTPGPVVDWLRRRGILADAVATDDGDGAVAVPDVAAVSVSELSDYITAAKPNAQATVELAAGDAGLAAKVLEAEDLSHGGDGRVTVVKPLQAIIDG